MQRVLAGRPIAHVAAEMGISRPTAYNWLRRWHEHGQADLHDRSSRPHNTPVALEAKTCQLRISRKLGPARIGPILGLAPSTVHRILTCHHLNRLAWLDRPTGQLIRCYEREHSGELIHVDVGRIPDGGGWHVHGPSSPPQPANSLSNWTIM